MYLSGADVPLILQGGGAYNAPPSSAPVPPVVLYGALGLLAAFLLTSGRSRGGKVW